jgi:O-antigen/teichoic acid export membrane protein
VARLSITGRAAAAYLLLAGLQRATGLLVLPFISHAMPPSEYGVATILTTSSLLLVAVLGAPLQQLVFRESARGGERAPARLRVAGIYCYAVLPVVFAVCAGAVALFLPELFGASGRIWGIEMLAAGFLPAATSYALPTLRARQNLRRFAWLALTSVVVTAVTKITLVVILQWGVFGWAMSDLISAILTASLAVALVRPPKARCRYRDLRAVLGFSVPLIPHQASFWALSSLSRPVLAMVSSLTQVGLLSFGLNLASVAALILAEINQATMPRFSRESFPAPTQATYSPVKWQLLFAVTVPGLVGAVIAFAGPFIFAQSYWSSFPLTGVLLVGQAISGMYMIPMNYLIQSAGLPRFSSIASLSGAFLVMAGLLLFGSRFGAAGAAYATAVGMLVMAMVALLLTFALKLDIRWSSWRACWPEMVLGISGLLCSVAALWSPISSRSAYIWALASVILALSALAVAYLRKNALGLPTL